MLKIFCSCLPVARRSSLKSVLQATYFSSLGASVRSPLEWGASPMVALGVAFQAVVRVRPSDGGGVISQGTCRATFQNLPSLAQDLRHQSRNGRPEPCVGRCFSRNFGLTRPIRPACAHARVSVMRMAPADFRPGSDSCAGVGFGRTISWSARECCRRCLGACNLGQLRIGDG